MEQFLLNRHDKKRVLIIGSEVGSLFKLIHEYNPKYELGAIDILGNIETRKYAKWKFSVAKQSPKLPISIPKNRSLTEYLIELVYVMLEEVEFDIIIPCSPLHSEQKFLLDLKNDYEVIFPFIDPIDCLSSNYSFLQVIKKKVQDFSSFYYNPDINSTSHNEKNHYFLVTKKKTDFVSSHDTTSIINYEDEGFLIPSQQLYCTAFIQNNGFRLYLGIQEVKIPDNKDSIIFPLENNAFTPPNSVILQDESYILTKLNLITSDLKLHGFFTIYFTLKPFDDPIPISLVPNFDQNLIMWQLKIQSFIFDLLSKNIQTTNLKTFFAFRLPIYSPTPITMYDIPRDYVIHQNISGVITSLDFPVCSIVGTSRTYDEARRLLITNRNEVLKHLNLV
ncbi:MAG: hypothetical protein ACTSW1_04055 [Candidatus Hodarchaeales archaeon]